MAELTVAMTYGNALFQAAKELDKKKLIKDELEEMIKLLKSEEEFLSFLNTPCVSAKEKKTVVNSIFNGKICDELLNFMFILIDKGRTRHLFKIAEIYDELLNQDEGFAYGKIYSAYPLPADKLAQFEAEAGKLIKENVRLENEIDKTLLGGVKILIDGKIIDASVKSRVEALAEAIK